MLQAIVGVLPWSDVVGFGPLLEAAKGGFLWDLLVYLLVVGGWQAVQYSQHYLASQLRLERLERSFFRSSFERASHAAGSALPVQRAEYHFFPGRQSAKLARGMIEQLGDLLRLSLESGASAAGAPQRRARLSWPLTSPIQKTRFGDSLHVVIEVSRIRSRRDGAQPYPATAGGERDTPRFISATAAEAPCGCRQRLTTTFCTSPSKTMASGLGDDWDGRSGWIGAWRYSRAHCHAPSHTGRRSPDQSARRRRHTCSCLDPDCATEAHSDE